MQYLSGGKHVPHFDNDFYCETESYRTLYSWVLYLNDVPAKQGGGFQFVDDGIRQPYSKRSKEMFADWTQMATSEQIIKTVQPKAGRLVVFPHWRCHQVQEFIASEECTFRAIIRGDLAYVVEQ